ncbi:translesion error-prone DNA polymerase V autoproteolytic subunit [Pantoea piersonii]|uniref:Translesion error-prone DNA polymerase V autoproteolytic subunit n=1 Tax=Pantoea piersonii TaxID=2364647 RepID=A0AAJ5QHG2_9GAMM|nr:translesion error-prone DNA polymerase V autoproteolytic subunit [Pantoea piersonii]WBG89564.1 translesion error-prone DNA polymerase V autoproteolytic subunit [Pantoea piersonii]
MKLYRPAEVRDLLPLPLYIERVPCGFPSPAQDYIEKRIDLNHLMVQHPSATYFLRVSGDSMIEAGIGEGDMIVVDSSLKAKHGDIIVAAIDGEFTIKQLLIHPSLSLMPANSKHSPIPIHTPEGLQVFGVVTYVIKSTH